MNSVIFLMLMILDKSLPDQEIKPIAEKDLELTEIQNWLQEDQRIKPITQKDLETAEIQSSISGDGGINPVTPKKGFGTAEIQSGLSDEGGINPVTQKDLETAEIQSSISNEGEINPVTQMDPGTADIQSDLSNEAAKRKDPQAAEQSELLDVLEERKNQETAKISWNNQMLNGMLGVCMEPTEISVRDSLRNIIQCIQAKNIRTEQESDIDIVSVSTTTEKSTTVASPLSTEYKNTTLPMPTTMDGPTEKQGIRAPYNPYLTRPVMWIGYPIRIWSWDELDNVYASNLPIVSTCITLLEVDFANSQGMKTSRVLCNLHVYNNDIAFQEVAACILNAHENWLINDLHRVFPAEYRFDDESCLDTYVPDPMYICVYTGGGFLNYPSTFLCTVNNTANMYLELEVCGVTDSIFNTGFLIAVQANDSCEDQETAQNMGILEFQWCIQKVQYGMILLCLLLCIMECVAVSQISIARNI